MAPLGFKSWTGQRPCDTCPPLCKALSCDLQDSNFSMYQRMWSFMESAQPTVFTNSNMHGVERVIKGKGNYAFLMESTSIEYVIERNCELTQVGGLLDSKGYGIAMPPSKCQLGITES